MNNTHPHYVEFIRKPVYAAMGLLAQLGNKILFSKQSDEKSHFNVLGTSFSQNNK